MKYQSPYSGMKKLALYTCITLTLLASAVQAKAQGLLDRFKTPDFYSGEISDNVKLSNGNGLEIRIGDGFSGMRDGSPDYLQVRKGSKTYTIRGSQYFEPVADHDSLETAIYKREAVKLYRKAKSQGRNPNINAIKTMAKKRAAGEVKKYKFAANFGYNLYQSAKKKSQPNRDSIMFQKKPNFKRQLFGR